MRSRDLRNPPPGQFADRCDRPWLFSAPDPKAGRAVRARALPAPSYLRRPCWLAACCRLEQAMPGGEPSDRLRLEYRTDDSVAIVDVDGEIDLFTCGLLRDRLLALADEGHTSLVVNLGA